MIQFRKVLGWNLITRHLYLTDGYGCLSENATRKGSPARSTIPTSAMLVSEGHLVLVLQAQLNDMSSVIAV